MGGTRSAAAAWAPASTPALLFGAGSLLSFLAAQCAVYALVIDAHARTASPVVAGVVFCALFVPLLVLAPLVSRAASAAGRGHVLWAAHVAAAIMLAIATVSLRREAPLFERIAVLVAYGTCWAFVPATRYSCISDVVPARQVGVVTVLLSIASVVALGASPALVERLERWADARTIVGGAAVAIAVSGALYGCAAPRRARAERPLESVGATRITEYGGDLVRCAIASAVIGPAHVLMPRHASEYLSLSGTDRGFFLSALGIGLLAGGAVALLPFSRRLPVDGILATALVTMALVPRPTAPMFAFIVYLFAATAAGTVLQVLQRRLQECVAEAQRGALMTVVAIVNQGVPGVAGFAAAALAVPLGIAPAVACWSLVLGIGLASLIARFPATPPLASVEWSGPDVPDR